MTGNEGLAALISVLNAGEYPYMIVGSYSSNFYGIPRSTKDADLVLSVASSDSGARLQGGYRTACFSKIRAFSKW